MDPALQKIVGVVLFAGFLGMMLGAGAGFFSGDQRLRTGTSAGIGFLIGAALGAMVAVFANLSGGW